MRLRLHSFSLLRILGSSLLLGPALVSRGMGGLEGVEMRVLLCQIDGSIPNLALMRIAAHHNANGDEVELRHGVDFRSRLWDSSPDLVYASAIFLKSRPAVERLFEAHPRAIVGGTGWDMTRTVEDVGISTKELDYSLYPRFCQSLGFTQRGCRLACSFCVVPKKEGAMREEASIYDIWRGDPWPRELLLLDNDFFGQPHWRERVKEIRDGGFKVSFNQGINARFLTDEAAEAIASLDYRDDSMKVKRIYTAWDNLKDEQRLFDGLNRLVKYGVKPDHVMVYILCGYWPGETHADRDHRRRTLREWGARPYPMPYVRTQELVGFQRWVIGAYDKPSKKNPNGIPWADWYAAHYDPRKLNPAPKTYPLLNVLEASA